MKKKRNMDLCEVPRWAQIKSQLNNLAYDDFVSNFEREKNAVLIDVRKREEFLTGSLPDALNINYLSQQLADELEALDPERPYYVFCRTGRRSLRVCALMQNMGLQVYNLDGGMQSKSQS